MRTTRSCSLHRRAIRRCRRLAAALLAASWLGVVAAETSSPHSPPWVAKLPDELAAVDAQNRVRIGVYVRDLDTGASASWRAEQRWYLASMVKVPVAMAVLRGMERGLYTFRPACRAA